MSDSLSVSKPVDSAEVPPLPSALDGWRVTPYQATPADDINIYLEYRRDGELTVAPACIASFPSTNEGQAEYSRVIPVMRALARFANAQGDVAKLPDCLLKMVDIIGSVPCAIPAGWTLVFASEEVDCPTLAFIDEAQQNGLLVCEDEFVEVVQADDLFDMVVAELDKHDSHSTMQS